MYIGKAEIMSQTPASIFFLAAVFVVFPVLDGFAAPLTSDLLDGTSIWIDNLLDILIVPAIVLGIVWGFRRRYTGRRSGALNIVS